MTTLTIGTAFGDRLQVTMLGRTAESIHVVLPSGLDTWVQPRSLKQHLAAEAAPIVSNNNNRVTEPGMYAVNGDIFRVQKSKTSDHLYAKRLTPIGGQRLTEDDHRVQWEFVYEQGAMRTLKSSDRMTDEQARAFGIRYGVCCVCGITLKDAKSVEAGIGPVCAKNV